MSGSFNSTGILTNGGKACDLDDIESIMNLKILNLSILIIPLSTGKPVFYLRFFGKLLQQFIHPMILSPTASHIAIYLSLEDGYNIIMEYGQYFSEKSEIRNTGLFSTNSGISNSSNEIKRNNENDFKYYYINKDGVRLTVLHSSYLDSLCERRDLSYAYKCLDILAANFYKIPYEEYFADQTMKNFPFYIYEFKIIHCYINNEMKLKDLCKEFQNDNWVANKYNFITHNCQHFSAEVIKILKAERMFDKDKVRMREKEILPNCIIKNLWENEKLSTINTIGRIPVIGLFYDLYYAYPYYQ